MFSGCFAARVFYFYMFEMLEVFYLLGGRMDLLLITVLGVYDEFVCLISVVCYMLFVVWFIIALVC